MNNNPRDGASDSGGRRDAEARARMQDELATAAATGDSPRVSELLRSGADVNGANRFGRTPVQVMMMGSTQVAHLLLSHGANPNVSDTCTGATPLHDAAYAGFLDTVRVLLEFRADPEQRDKRGRTPADSATESRHLDTAEYINNFTSSKPQRSYQQQ